MLNSIFRNDLGKHPAAVYFCEISTTTPEIYTDTWIEQLFPRSYGVSVTSWGVTRTPDLVRWYTLIVNDKQTTVSDVSERIERRGYELTATWGFSPRVHVVAALPGRGTGPERESTPRAGTKRIRKNSTPVKTVAAL